MINKVPNDKIIESYGRLKSVWLVGKELGICGQSVHERLVKLAKNSHINIFTEQEEDNLKLLYPQYVGIGELSKLALMMGRTKQFICRKARSIGLTNPKRKKPYVGDRSKIFMKQYWAEHDHPKGMLGKKHSDDTKLVISKKSTSTWFNMTNKKKLERNMKIMKTRDMNGNYAPHRIKTTWKGGWRMIGGINKYYRSRWEANYARYLEFILGHGNILGWKHEPKVFWFEGIKRGCCSYLPDFLVKTNNGKEEYHEVKGWMDNKSKTKIRRMAKYFPDIKLVVIDSKAYQSLAKNMCKIVPGWE